MLKSPQFVLKHFIDAIEAEKEFIFDMNNWYRNPNQGAETKPFEIPNTCGTSACIAGTVAYRLDPKSKVSASTMIMEWVGLDVEDVWGSLKDDASYEDTSCDSCLDKIFTSAYLYDSYDLADVEKDEVLSVLKGLLVEFPDTWVELLELIEGITEGRED